MNADITGLPTRPLTVAMIVLGAAIISIVHSVRTSMPGWPFEWMLAGSLPHFIVQVLTLCWISDGKSPSRAFRGFLLFFAFVLLNGAVFYVAAYGMREIVEDAFAFPFVLFMSVFLTFPSTALFALLIATTLAIDYQKYAVLGRLAAVLFSATIVAVAGQIITSHQRVIILHAVEDVKLYATDDLRAENQVGTLPSGTEVVVAYCIDTKHYITPVIAMPNQPGIFAQAGPGQIRVRREQNGLFSRPRQLGCGWW